jgi:hypothetical protein
MSTAGWVFMVGLRVVDLGALVLWLVWFFKLRDDTDEDDGRWGDGGAPGPEGPNTPPRPRDGIPLPDAGPWPVRVRDHASPRPASRTARREHVPRPRPRTPA